MSNKVVFLLLTMPFFCGVPDIVNWDKILLSMMYSKNSLDKYYPP